MTVYSHSRLSCYEQCPAKFKLQYIEKVDTEAAETIEAFLGSRVHETLEKLYRDLDHQKMNTHDELLGFLQRTWAENWSDDILIVNQDYTPENYRRMAEKYVTAYYQRYTPFTQGKTVALEERILITLDPSKKYKLQGYIDRLTEVRDGFYEIHDYKTNARLPLAEYLRTDRQLALYMIGVKDVYPDVQDIRLVWHFLKFDKEVVSTRTDEELTALKTETIRLIQQIEEDEVYAAHPGVLCEWCEYKPLCRQWRHLSIIAEKPPTEYHTESGVQLVDRYAEIKTAQKLRNNEWDAELERLETALLAYAEQQSIDCVFGSKNKVRITENERYVFPAKGSQQREQLERILLKYGKLTEVQQLDTTALARILQEEEWATEVLQSVHKYLQVERKKRLHLSKKKEE
jgi:putative RecB family exonuclease